MLLQPHNHVTWTPVCQIIFITDTMVTQPHNHVTWAPVCKLVKSISHIHILKFSFGFQKWNNPSKIWEQNKTRIPLKSYFLKWKSLCAIGECVLRGCTVLVSMSHLLGVSTIQSHFMRHLFIGSGLYWGFVNHQVSLLKR